MKRILVCLDSSPRASFVLAQAESLARATGAKLVPLHAVGWPHDGHPPPEALAVTPAELLDIWKEKAERALQTLLARVPAELREPAHVVVGVPWDAICRSAKELDVDLVVIGAHSYHTLDRLLGTTASKVVSHCDRSTLVVRG